MTQIYARKNFRLPSNITSDAISEWQELLHDAAIDGGAFDDIDVFYSEKERVIGVSVPIENDPMLVLEAGAILGYVTAAVDRSALDSPERWMSVHNESGDVIESTF
jgi:hypothetical protein